MSAKLRILIVGAGSAGVMAAWRLAKAGHEAIVLEQFKLDHDRGSSYGDSRIVRRVYSDALYTALMADAYRLWDELQGLYPDRELFRQVGGLFFGADADPRIAEARAALLAGGVDFDLLGPEEAEHRFPALRMARDEVGLWEPSMGYARASRCVRAAAEAAIAQGACIVEQSRVTEIGPAAAGNGQRVQAKLDDGDILTGDRILLTAGPWVNQLLRKHGVMLPTNITRQAYLHLQPERNEEWFEVGRFPVWIDAGVEAYGFPRLGDLPGVKIAMHARGDEVDADALYGGSDGADGTDVRGADSDGYVNDAANSSLESGLNSAFEGGQDRVDRELRETDRECIRQYARKRFRGLGDGILCEKVCLYTNTPDSDFIVDAVPGLTGAFVVSACSGHGFKFGPLIGQIAANLATDLPPGYDIARFRLDRFSANSSSPIS